MAFTYVGLGDHYEGSTQVDASLTERIDAALFLLTVGHNLDRYLTLAARVPVGTIWVEPMGGPESVVSGFGDIELSVAYELGRFWGLKGRRPSLRIRPFLLLPTGESSQIGGFAENIPPNRLAIGNGAVGFGGDLQLTVPLTRKWHTKAWLSARGPIGYGETDVWFGTMVNAGLGARVRARDWLLLDADLALTARASSRERGIGTIVNSGGQWLIGEVRASFVLSKRAVFGASVQMPLYIDVNGTQITQNIGAGGFVTLLFGASGDEHKHGEKGDEHGDGHEHGEKGHEHDDGHEDGEKGHGTGESGHEHGPEGNENNHRGHSDSQTGHDHESADNDRRDDGHRHGPDSDSHETHEGGGDVAVLASGGASFKLADARVPGKLVAIDFWAEWCVPCKGIESLLHRRASADARLAVRKVEVPSFDHPVAREHLSGAEGLPVVWLLGPDGAVLARLEKVTAEELDRQLTRSLAALPEP